MEECRAALETHSWYLHWDNRKYHCSVCGCSFPSQAMSLDIAIRVFCKYLSPAHTCNEMMALKIQDIHDS